MSKPAVTDSHKIHKFEFGGIVITIDYSLDGQVDVTIEREGTNMVGNDTASFCYSENFTTFCVGDGKVGKGVIRNIKKLVTS